MIIKKTIQYGMANGLSRSAAILFMPILTFALSKNQYGVFAIAQAFVSLAVPILSLNGTAAIMREGFEKLGYGKYLLIRYLLLTCCLGCLAFIVELFFVKTGLPLWVVWATLLASSEAIWFLLLGFLRCFDKGWSYLFTCIFKVAGIAAVFAIFSLHFELSNVLLYIKAQLIFSFVINIVLALLLIFDVTGIKKPFYAAVVFSSVLILHSAGQWIMSAADRFVVKFYLGYGAVGKYSIAYNIALILGLLNAGIAMVIPQLIIQDYNNWLKREKHFFYIGLYGCITILLLLAMRLGLYIDQTYLHIFHFYFVGFWQYVAIIYSGLAFLGYYYLYANFLFYWRKSSRIAAASLVTGFVNIILTVALIYVVGLMGAAIATFITYFVYFLLISYFACNVEKKLKKRFFEDAVLIAIFNGILLSCVVI